MGIRCRGVQEIKTLASVLGSGAHSNERHVRQFQLASLELERTRRGREKQAAARRIGDIDARLVEIDGLIRKHQDALALNRPEGPDPERVAAGPDRGPATGKRHVLRY